MARAFPVSTRRTAAGTLLAEGKETKVFDGTRIRARGGHPVGRVDRQGVEGRPAGNLIYRETARNFNPMIASCGNVTVAEVEELVDAGELDPNQIHTPGIYVDRIVQGAAYEKRIEFRTVAGTRREKGFAGARDDGAARRTASCATATT